MSKYTIQNEQGKVIARLQSKADAYFFAAAPVMASNIQGALDSLSQHKVFPADIENAKRLLIKALETAGIEPLSLDRKAMSKAEGK